MSSYLTELHLMNYHPSAGERKRNICDTPNFMDWELKLSFRIQILFELFPETS